MAIMPMLSQPLKVPPMAQPMPKGAPLSYGMAQSNIGGAPVAPSPIVGPNLPGGPTPQPINFTPPTIGAAPTATPTGAFTGPDLSNIGNDPYYQFRLAQANKGAERSAAARGTLLSGGFQTALARMNQGMASEEGDKIYNRALSAYGINRDTNQQNFGQSLASYNAGTGAALDAGRLGLAGETARYGSQRDTINDARDDARTQANTLNVNNQAQQAYQQQMADYNAALEAQRQAENARVNAATDAARGTMPVRRPLPGAVGPFGQNRR